MRSPVLAVFVFFTFSFLIQTSVFSQQDKQNICIECHQAFTPSIVADWRVSQHSEHSIACDSCHGKEHSSAEDVDKVKLPTASTCGGCHQKQFEQFKAGKHALAWSAMKAMPSLHAQPIALTEGMKGCGGCHKIGLKSEDELKELSGKGYDFGNASCDSCHTRHAFSKEEAQQPQACATCHMGFDHPQWEMFSTSKHGVRFALKQAKILPESAAAPGCQGCHIKNGSHANRTGWGFLAVRLPMPEDGQWAADRAVILQGLGVLDPEGKPTARLDIVKEQDLCRLTEESFREQRSKMLANCNQCHSGNFAKKELEKGDAMIRQADHLLAQAIKIIAGLYKDKIIAKPDNYVYDFPDLLAFHEAPTAIELKLFEMFMEYRMRAFQGAFHMNPDYTLWYGWSKLKQSLAEIKSMEKGLRSSTAGNSP